MAYGHDSNMKITTEEELHISIWTSEGHQRLLMGIGGLFHVTNLLEHYTDTETKHFEIGKVFKFDIGFHFHGGYLPSNLILI